MRAVRSARYGLVLLRKPEGVTSFRALGPVKRRLELKKIGHAGTLDRFAGGLLVALCGSYSRLAGFVQSGAKLYRASACFGAETDTLDPEGAVIAEAAPPSRESLLNVLPLFTGDIMQAPPAYSALHVNGVRAYELAAAGYNLEMKKRPVRVHSLKLISYEGSTAVFEISCSSGTYIRSLARDIALACGSRAHLTALERLAIGPYRLQDAVRPEDFDPDRDLRLFSQADAAGLGLGVAVVPKSCAERFRTGSKLRAEDLRKPGPAGGAADTAVFGEDDSFLGIVHIDAQALRYRFVVADQGK